MRGNFFFEELPLTFIERGFRIDLMVDHALAVTHKECHHIFFISNIITWPDHSLDHNTIFQYFLIIPHDSNFCLWQISLEYIEGKLTCFWYKKCGWLISKKFCQKIRIKMVEMTVWYKNIINLWESTIVKSDSFTTSHEVSNTYIWEPAIYKNSYELIFVIWNFDEAFRMSERSDKHIRFFREICYNVCYLWFCFLWLLLVFRRAQQAHFILVRFEQHFIRICSQSKIMELLFSESKIQTVLDLSNEQVIIFFDFSNFLVVLRMSDME